MSKDYKGALYFLMTETHEYNGGKIIPLAQNAIDDLQELVDLNEPMKVGIQVYTNGFFKNWRCENCHNSIEEKYANYCSDCGQKLDWNE